ncbi:bifunctional riboflavin kinase/FAD synthetase [Parafrigoribacterium soli]|uniref:bifunctional riboflavin kinase/FAD synthetase n=1 Tax=Parafrigoribacterium soli TaxID=3144663 RepID=UPI0032F05581
MQFYTSLNEVPHDFGPSAVTIGKFDGVHSGHRAVIGELLSMARPLHLVPTVVTFDRHPLALLNPPACPPQLISNEQKVERLSAAGVEATLMLTFDRALSEQSPEEFVQHVLVDALHARIVFVGSDFRYGVRGSGTVETLREAGREHGFEIRLVDEVRAKEGRRASSTWIREALAAGNVREAGDVLGALPTVRSVVVRGEQRGRTLGYPTANLRPGPEGLIPADGVYAGWLAVASERYPAAISVGNNPTFEGVPDRQVEAYVLDRDIDLYDKTVEVSFVDYIRGMKKFDGVAELIAEIEHDVSRVREILGAPHPNA